MMLWQDVSGSNRLGPPACLEGAVDLQSREDANGRLWGIGDPRLIGPQNRGWIELNDGWRVKAMPGFDPMHLARSLPWCPSVVVGDLYGRSWTIPAPLNSLGESRIVGAYDATWNRVLTPEQALLERIAKAARCAWIAASPEEGVTPILPTVAEVCAWAVAAICATNHISPDAIGKLTFLDEQFAKSVAFVIAGVGCGEL